MGYNNEVMRHKIHYRILALWKFCLSFCKHDWTLSDYPVVVNEQDPGLARQGPRWKPQRYIASIVNWAIAGVGDTKEDALRDLEKGFESGKAERIRTGVRLPRPGTSVPLQFASSERINAHRDLAEDFIHRVLELQWAWISDESTLWDFHADETNVALISRIKDVYGVDVSDIGSARLYEILDRIAAVRQSN